MDRHPTPDGLGRPSNVTLINAYLEYMRIARRRQPSTLYKYARSYAIFIRFLGPKSMLDADFDDIMSYLRRPHPRTCDGLASPATFKRELMELRSLYK